MSSLTPTSRSQLLFYLRADQSQRWQRGERVRVEDYLTQYPHLAGDAEAILALIAAELLHRQETGEQPSLEEYVRRFPPYADALRRCWPWLLLGQPRDRSENDTPESTAAENTKTNPLTRQASRAPSLPGFTLQEKLGQGGMGVVYRAWDVGLGQPRAVKVIRAGFGGEQAHERFQREAKAVARLDHPGVVRIYALGEHDGDLFISMEFLEGGNLSARLRQGPLAVREAADLVRQLALAVQHAHDNKVLHRDLKPANVLLSADGKPKVGDFGLAKLLDEDDGLTRTGEVMGTPSYMAPEQADGRLKDIGARTDVWSLGAILYECLSGQPPFRGESRSQTMELVKREGPASLRRLRAEVPAALENVCLKCLEKRIEDRYATAADLADDLQAWLDGKAVRARPNRRLLRRWLTLTLTAVLFLGIGMGVFLLSRDHQSEPDIVSPPAVELPPVPGVPFPLLTREPAVLRWPQQGKNTYKRFLPEMREMNISCEEVGLIALGETSASRYQFAITIHQKPWIGNLGVFFGYRERQGEEGASQHYQVLELKSEELNARQGRLLQVDWNSISHFDAAKEPGRFIDMQNASPSFSPTAAPHRLELTVGPKGLEKVKWDDRVLDGLCAEKATLPPPRAAYRGKFGIYAREGSGIFRDATYLFQEEP